MKKLHGACALILGGSLAAVALAADTAPPGMSGFSAAGAASQRTLEQRFDSQINAEDLREWMKTMASGANHVGSPHDKENAEFTLQQFRAWGWNAEIEQFDVLYPTLRHHSLELVGPTKFVASLKEPPLEGDESSARTDGIAPYHAYGADGDVTADLVYVNYGMPDDYKHLARRGVDVKGKIVIARYGAGWRGLKPKLAYEHGAVGCLIYSDPRDDGYSQGDVYPKGGWRPAGSVQRGSVADMPVYAGDPLTPGVGATKNAKRLTRAQAKTILKIPVMPISYGDAKPLLEALEGPVAPAGWRGGLPITYHMGPGPAKVHLVIESDWNLKPLYNVIARVPGSESPDEWVVRGNHRDGWVFGAWDPLSGHGAMLAEAKAIGALLKTGWKPKRTIVYASWDGEEPGLLGSTEWAEAHGDELQRKAVIYINSDTNTRGFLGAAGSHSFQRFMNEIAASVKDPQTGVSVGERVRALMLMSAFEDGSAKQKQDAKKVEDGGDLPIEALGSGSDFTPFLQHLGLGTLNIEYGGEEDQGGVYHSNYDSFEHYVRFGDPQFAYGVAEAQTVGRAVLRLADADVLPMQIGGFADAVSGYLDELHKLTDDKRQRAEDLSKLLERNAFGLAADPTRVVGPPERESEVPYLNFTPLDNAIARLQKSAKAYDDAFAKVQAGTVSLTPAKRKSVNAQLRVLEQALTSPDGLPGREWYRHLIYAPGLLTGYGVKTLPAVREAIEDYRWAEADRYSAITAAALAGYCDKLDRITAELK